MSNIFLNELECGGPGTSIGYPNLRSCVSLTAVLANGTLVGAHLTREGDIAVVAPRFVKTIGAEGIKRLYLIGGYTLAGDLHGGMAAHPAKVASALGYSGQVGMYDTSRFLAVLLVVDQADLSGQVRVQYKDWDKLTPDNSPMQKGEHPYKDTKNPYVSITLDVKRKPKKSDNAPALIMHTIPPKKLTIVDV